MFSVGKATITRIEETYLAVYARDSFPEFTDAHHAPSTSTGWRPHHYEPAPAKIKLSVHSWLLQIGGQKILIDSCCGNDGMRATGRSGHAQYALSRTARGGRCAAGRDRPGDVHASASRSCRLEHAAEGRQMGADVPERALRVLQARCRLLPRRSISIRRTRRPSSAHSANACCRSSRPARADLVRRHVPAQRPHRDRCRRRAIRPATWCSSWRAAGSTRAFIGDVFHHLLQVYYPHWNFPKNSDAEQARVSRRKVLDIAPQAARWCSPGHVGLPFAGRVEATAKGFRPDFAP